MRIILYMYNTYCIASISEIPASFYSWADRFESCLVAQFWRQVLSWCGSDFSLTAELREKKEVSIIWASVWQNQQNYLCAQRRRRSAWASTQSDQSLCCTHEETLVPYLSTECKAKTDQTGQIPGLIWVFAGRTGHFVGFVALQLF